MNWVPSPKLTAFVRFSVSPLRHPESADLRPCARWTSHRRRKSRHRLRRYLQLNHRSYLRIYSVNGARCLFGFSRQDTTSEQPRLDEKLGLDFLGIPGTNGSRAIEGGWPRFQISSFATLGVNEDYMPYYRSDPAISIRGQLQLDQRYTQLRFGGDLYRQASEPRPARSRRWSLSRASGGFNFTGGPTSTRGGPSANRFNLFAAFLLGVANNTGKTFLFPMNTTYGWRSTVCMSETAGIVTPETDTKLRLRWRFSVARRPDRGIERYDPSTNQMLLVRPRRRPKIAVFA